MIITNIALVDFYENNATVVTRNPNYINKQQSSYQREFSDTIHTSDTREEALEFLAKLEV